MTPLATGNAGAVMAQGKASRTKFLNRSAPSHPARAAVGAVIVGHAAGVEKSRWAAKANNIPRHHKIRVPVITQDPRPNPAEFESYPRFIPLSARLERRRPGAYDAPTNTPTRKCVLHFRGSKRRSLPSL